MGISVAVAGDGEAAGPCLSPHRAPMSLGPPLLQLCLKSQSCSQIVTTAETSCRHLLDFWTCLGNENYSSYIKNQVLHWDSLRTGSVSPRARGTEAAEAFPLPMLCKDVGCCSQRAVITYPVFLPWKPELRGRCQKAVKAKAVSLFPDTLHQLFPSGCCRGHQHVDIRSCVTMEVSSWPLL